MVGSFHHGRKQWENHLPADFLLAIPTALVFRDKVSVYSPGSPGTPSVDQAGLKLRDLPASASLVLGSKIHATTALPTNYESYCGTESTSHIPSAAHLPACPLLLPSGSTHSTSAAKECRPAVLWDRGPQHGRSALVMVHLVPQLKLPLP